MCLIWMAILPRTERISFFLNAVGRTEENKQKYDEVVKACSDFCSPKTNEVYESFVFHGRNQAIGEPFDQFLNNLKNLSRTCEFGELENRMLRTGLSAGLQIRTFKNDYLKQTRDNTCIGSSNLSVNRYSEEIRRTNTTAINFC